jgi:GT2 family glycosyltransferase
VAADLTTGVLLGSVMSTSATIDLSIIIVSWNTRDLLLQCLRSIRSNDASLITEVIVVDNGSTDGSVNAVREQFPDVRIIENETNVGFARANNQAIVVSCGRYICLINSDVKLDDRCLPLLHQHMEANPEVGILGPKIFNTDRTLQASFRTFPSLWSTFCRALALDTILSPSHWLPTHDIEPNCRAREVDILSGCFWVVRRSALEQVGLLDEQFFMYAEDKDWCKRFRRAGWRLVYFPAASAIHYGGASSSGQRTRFDVEYVRANVKYWRKHHGRTAFVAFFLLSLLHQIIRIGGGALMYLVQPSRRQSARSLVQRSLACTRSLLQI